MPSPVPRASELVVGPEDILCFVDETGGLSVSERQSPLFGLGAVLLWQHQMAELTDRWASMKERLFDDRTRRLHAADLPADRLHEIGSEVGAFFEDASFLRLGVTCSRKVARGPHVAALDGVFPLFIKGMLRLLKTAIAEWQSTPGRVVMILEHNDELLRVYQRAAEGTRLQLGLHGDVWTVPMVWGVLKKGEVGLEWADFVAQASHRRSVGLLKKETRQGKDFVAIFRGKNEERSFFADVNEIVTRVQTCWDVFGGFRWAGEGTIRIDIANVDGWVAMSVLDERRHVSLSETARRFGPYG
jgi:hypothetical protein